MEVGKLGFMGLAGLTCSNVSYSVGSVWTIDKPALWCFFLLLNQLIHRWIKSTNMWFTSTFLKTRLCWVVFLKHQGSAETLSFQDVVETTIKLPDVTWIGTSSTAEVLVWCEVLRHLPNTQLWPVPQRRFWTEGHTKSSSPNLKELQNLEANWICYHDVR